MTMATIISQYAHRIHLIKNISLRFYGVGIITIFFLLYNGHVQGIPTPQMTNDIGSAINIVRITEPIHLDGRVEEKEWGRITPLKLMSYEPDAGLEPTERTEIRIGYDDHYI